MSGMLSAKYPCTAEEIIFDLYKSTHSATGLVVVGAPSLDKKIYVGVSDMISSRDIEGSISTMIISNTNESLSTEAFYRESESITKDLLAMIQKAAKPVIKTGTIDEIEYTIYCLTPESNDYLDNFEFNIKTQIPYLRNTNSLLEPVSGFVPDDTNVVALAILDFDGHATMGSITQRNDPNKPKYIVGVSPLGYKTCPELFKHLAETIAKTYDTKITRLENGIVYCVDRKDLYAELAPVQWANMILAARPIFIENDEIRNQHIYGVAVQQTTDAEFCAGDIVAYDTQDISYFGYFSESYSGDLQVAISAMIKNLILTNSYHGRLDLIAKFGDSEWTTHIVFTKPDLGNIFTRSELATLLSSMREG